MLQDNFSRHSLATYYRESEIFKQEGKAGKTFTFLLDSRCTTNLLSRWLSDTHSARDKAGMEQYDGEHGMLAGGSCIIFYGIVELHRIVKGILTKNNINFSQNVVQVLA